MYINVVNDYISVNNNIINLTKQFINNIIFSRIPGHCGIAGNERVEILTKKKVNNPHQKHL